MRDPLLSSLPSGHHTQATQKKTFEYFQAFFALSAVLACATASVIPAAPGVTIQKAGYGPSSFVRAPAHDSASIESHRLGGNFAYSTAEAHAYASVTPEISVATHPVAETTYTHVPAPIKTIQPAPIVKTHHAASPVYGQQDILAEQPVIGPVRQHTQVHQQVYKQQHVAVHQPISHHQVATAVVAEPAIAAAPVAAYAAAPAAAYAAAPAAAYAAAPAALGYAGYAAAPALAAAPVAAY